MLENHGVKSMSSQRTSAVACRRSLHRCSRWRQRAVPKPSDRNCGQLTFFPGSSGTKKCSDPFVILVCLGDSCIFPVTSMFLYCSYDFLWFCEGIINDGLVSSAFQVVQRPLGQHQKGPSCSAAVRLAQRWRREVTLRCCSKTGMVPFPIATGGTWVTSDV